MGAALNDSILWCRQLINSSNLLHLDLSGSKLSKCFVNGLSSALSLNSSLESLNFGRCDLDDQSLAKIVQSVKEHPNLMKLDISSNFLGKDASKEAVDAVAKLLCSKTSKLESLNISSQQQSDPKTFITDVTEREEERYKNAFKNALLALSANTTLRRIDLSSNIGCFSDMNCLKALASCLATNSGLSYVDISACHLAPIGIQYLAQNCIPYCSEKLKSFILFDGESIDSSIIKNENWNSTFLSLERALQFNSALESLGNFGSTAVDSKSKNDLQYLLNVNRAGRRAFQSDTFPLAAWPNVLARASRIQYDNHYEDNHDSSDSIENEESLSTFTSASVLFELLHGPAMFIDVGPRKRR